MHYDNFSQKIKHLMIELSGIRLLQILIHHLYISRYISLFGTYCNLFDPSITLNLQNNDYH